ncbi:MAG: hypothetical protein CV087_21770 [Candidatus Brocadia sp. WS118]|nr:MAG: hypothetical protein CV087_21770 [Candidatus Brocadia sp. WS118]
MREINYYPPDKRRYVQNNLQCFDCGNTHAFFIDLRLRHQVAVHPGGFLEVSLDPRVQKTLKNIQVNIWRMLRRDDRQFIHCANCEDGSIYMQEEILEYCCMNGCPGCETCGNYISKAEVLDFCGNCIIQRDGEIGEDDCSTCCPHFEEGLGAVRDHYGISFDELKKELGFNT